MLLCGSSGTTGQRKHAVGAGYMLFSDAAIPRVAASDVGASMLCVTLRHFTANMKSWPLIM